MIVALSGSLWYLPYQLVWWTGHDLWLWLFLDHYDTFSSSWCDGQAMSFDCGDRPWSRIVALPGSLWYLLIQLVWWTGHDLWLLLFLDHYDTFPSSWCDGQAMIFDCGSSWIIMIPSLPAGVMDRPLSMIVALPGLYWYLPSSWCDGQARIPSPFQLVWWTSIPRLWLFLDYYDTFPSSCCDG